MEIERPVDPTRNRDEPGRYYILNMREDQIIDPRMLNNNNEPLLKHGDTTPYLRTYQEALQALRIHVEKSSSDYDEEFAIVNLVQRFDVISSIKEVDNGKSITLKECLNLLKDPDEEEDWGFDENLVPVRKGTPPF